MWCGKCAYSRNLLAPDLMSDIRQLLLDNVENQPRTRVNVKSNQ